MKLRKMKEIRKEIRIERRKRDKNVRAKIMRDKNKSERSDEREKEEW